MCQSDDKHEVILRYFDGISLKQLKLNSTLGMTLTTGQKSY